MYNLRTNGLGRSGGSAADLAGRGNADQVMRSINTHTAW